MADSVDLDQIPQTGVWSRELGLQSLHCSGLSNMGLLCLFKSV